MIDVLGTLWELIVWPSVPAILIFSATGTVMLRKTGARCFAAYALAYACVASSVWIAWTEGRRHSAMPPDHFKVGMATALISITTVAIVALPMLAVERLRAGAIIVGGISLVASIVAIVVFPLLGLYAACTLLGDCL